MYMIKVGLRDNTIYYVYDLCKKKAEDFLLYVAKEKRKERGVVIIKDGIEGKVIGVIAAHDILFAHREDQ